MPGYYPSLPATCGECHPVGFRSGVEARSIARIRPPDRVHTTPLRTCVGRECYYSATNPQMAVTVTNYEQIAIRVKTSDWYQLPPA